MEDEDYFRFDDDVMIKAGEHLGVGIAPHATYPVAINCPTDVLYIVDFDIGELGCGYIQVNNGSVTGYISIQSAKPIVA